MKKTSFKDEVLKKSKASLGLSSQYDMIYP